MALSLKGICKSFTSTGEVLRDLDLDIPKGSFVSLIGPSGCGKSTLLRLIAGLEAATLGEIELGHEQTSVVFQDARLLPWRRSRENIALPGEIQGQAVSEARIMEVLEMVGLADYADAWPSELSGGMKMRVSLARALITNPDLMLLDEPFGALDEMTREKLNDELLRLWERYNWTLVFVTHNIFEAVYLSQKIYVMGGLGIKSSIDVPFDYPRDAALRADADYAQLVGQCQRQLREASHAES